MLMVRTIIENYNNNNNNLTVGKSDRNCPKHRAESEGEKEAVGGKFEISGDLTESQSSQVSSPVAFHQLLSLRHFAFTLHCHLTSVRWKV